MSARRIVNAIVSVLLHEVRLFRYLERRCLRNKRSVILFETLPLYKSFTYLLTYFLTSRTVNSFVGYVASVH